MTLPKDPTKRKQYLKDMSERAKLRIGTKNPMFGRKASEKNKRAVSKANKGNKYWLGRKHKLSSKLKISKAKKNTIGWNKGLTKETDIRVAKYSRKGIKKGFAVIKERRPHQFLKHQKKAGIKGGLRRAELYPYKGKDNPRYIHGNAHALYPMGWTAKSREVVRKYDYTCQKCGIKEHQLKDKKKKLCTHHINCNPSNISNKNLIPLCGKCNTNVEKTNEKDYWFAYFCYKKRINPEELVK